MYQYDDNFHNQLATSKLTALIWVQVSVSAGVHVTSPREVSYLIFS